MNQFSNTINIRWTSSKSFSSKRWISLWIFHISILICCCSLAKETTNELIDRSIWLPAGNSRWRFGHFSFTKGWLLRFIESISLLVMLLLPISRYSNIVFAPSQFEFIKHSSYAVFHQFYRDISLLCLIYWWLENWVTCLTYFIHQKK